MSQAVQVPLSLDAVPNESAWAGADILTVFTIGFTQKTAKTFFGLLKSANVRRVVDTRIFPNTQLSAFAKGVDLPYFLAELCGAQYEHRLEFAPTEDMLKAYRDKVISWAEYERRYRALIGGRRVESVYSREGLLGLPTAFLCSEATSDRCHRRLLVEYLEGAYRPLRRVDL